MQPIIGMLAEIDDDKKTAIHHAYVFAIENSGGLPLLFPYIENEQIIDRFTELCDGFLFTGGMDIAPKYYNEKQSPFCGTSQSFRDKFEFRVIKKVLATEKPILCICRGAQLLNVALGGSLYQDIPNECPSNIAHRQAESKFSPSHDVNIFENTPLSRLIGTARMVANSFHHQAIKALGDGLRVMATADDGIIEAVYYDSDRYVRAYQWHPERLFEIENNNRLLFKDFISECESVLQSKYI